MPLLHPGDTFPDIEVDRVGDGKLALPEALVGTFGVVLFNRGAWCPFCTAQLRGFQRAHDDLAAVDAQVVSLSVDDEQTSQELVDKHGLGFALGHSADAHALSELTGAFMNPDPVYLQATGFVLDPDGKVMVSAYSSGAIGRLIAEDVVGLVSHARRSGS